MKLLLIALFAFPLYADPVVRPIKKIERPGTCAATDIRIESSQFHSVSVNGRVHSSLELQMSAKCSVVDAVVPDGRTEILDMTELYPAFKGQALVISPKKLLVWPNNGKIRTYKFTFPVTVAADRQSHVSFFQGNGWANYVITPNQRQQTAAMEVVRK